MKISMLLFFTIILQTIALDYYKTLGVSKNADLKEIKKAYRKLSLQHHPDKGGDKKKFEEINKAYEVLSDPEQRKKYDVGGEEALKNGGGGPHMDPNDIFQNFFKFQDGGFGFGDGGFSFNFGGNHQQQRKQEPPQPQRTPNIEIVQEVTLEDTYKGGKINVDFKREKMCPHCHGHGAESEKDLEKCSQCHGQGFVYHSNGRMRQKAECPKCHGVGKTVKNKCHQCHGKGTTTKSMSVPVTLKRGVNDGDKEVIKGFANDKYGMKPGDIIVKWKVKNHPVFTRKGSDLYASITVSLLESLVGFERQLIHLNGEKINIIQKQITPHGTVLTYNNMGFPLTERSSRFGNLYVTINVMYPKSLSQSQKKQLEAILK